MSLRRLLFGDGLAGSARPLRPGRLSTELALAQKRGGAAQKPLQTPGRGAATLRPPTAGGGRVAMPGMVRGAGGGRVAMPGMVRGGRMAQPAARPPAGPAGGRTMQAPTQRGGLLMARPRGLSGLGAVGSFQPNGQVWVAQTLVPLVTSIPCGTGPYQPLPLVYPDGTPAMAQFWLPRLNLASFSPAKRSSDRLFDAVQVAGDPVARGLGRGNSGWVPSAFGTQLLGEPTYEFILDYDCREETSDNRKHGVWLGLPRVGVPNGTTPNGTPVMQYDINFWWEEFFERACGYLGDVDRSRFHYVADFNWSGVPPSRAARVWLELNLFSGDMDWAAMDASLYRLDGGNPLQPAQLPGAAWLDLNFLDAIQTGAHGMPVLVRPDGTLDSAKLTAFINAHPDDWAMVLGQPADASLAIINDVGTQAPTVVHVPSATPGGGGGPSDEDLYRQAANIFGPRADAPTDGGPFDLPVSDAGPPEGGYYQPEGGYYPPPAPPYGQSPYYSGEGGWSEGGWGSDGAGDVVASDGGMPGAPSFDELVPSSDDAGGFLSDEEAPSSDDAGDEADDSMPVDDGWNF